MLYNTLSIIKNKKIHKRYYPEYAQCFDRFIKTTGSKRGISGYWQAKRLSMMSENSVKIEQVTKTLRPHNWITIETSLDGIFDFIIIRKKGFIKNQPDVSLIYDANLLNRGISENEIYTCGWFDVLYYSKGFRIKTS